MTRTLFALAATVAAPAATTEPATKFGTLASGEVAPDFTVADAGGKTVQWADFRGRVVIGCFGTTKLAPADVPARVATGNGAKGVTAPVGK